MNYMKVVGAFLSIWLVGVAFGAPVPAAPTSNPPVPQVEKSIDELITDLSSDRFKIREAASRKLWDAGESAIEALQKASQSEDPETSYRSLSLLRYLELHITPDTDPSVIELVEKYQRATSNEKRDLIDEMRKKRAWRQILKLYASEKDPELLESMSRTVENVALLGAREEILKGNSENAKAFLEMAPATSRTLLALADFHRAHGSWQAEVERALASDAPGAAAWRLALYRTNGDFENARTAASKAGDSQVAAMMAMLGGDPIPWMRRHLADAKSPALRAAISATIQSWEGKPLLQADLEPMTRLLASRDDSERWTGTGLLFLLGKPELAEKTYAELSPQGAFQYFESLERTDDALAVIGLDPQNPDFSGWASERFTELLENGEQSEKATFDLLLLGGFLDARGMTDESTNVFAAPMKKLSEESGDAFANLLRGFFGADADRPQALGIARRIGLAWAGDDDLKWDALLDLAFDEDSQVDEWWTWIGEIDPKTTRVERFDAMLALFDRSSDPDRLREKWLTLAWKTLDAKPANQRPELMRRIGFLAARTGDVETSLRVWDRLPEDSQSDDLGRYHELNLSAANRWEEAAEWFEKRIEKGGETGQLSRPDFHAYAASSLRKAGREKDAAFHDTMAEKLALGDATVCLRMGQGYAYGGDYPRAQQWWKRAAFVAAPPTENDPNEFTPSINRYSDALLEEQQWRQAASTAEALGLVIGEIDLSNAMPALLLRMRLKADLPRALSQIKTDRKMAVKILEKCHRMLLSDGSLADEFFPKIRQAGLTDEHDRWFEQTWNVVDAAIQRYPKSETTRNTAAWLASRAMRHLDEAEKHLRQALIQNPNQPAYLDTMAEIQFARGNRKSALEWSQQSVNFAPNDEIIRRQHLRFETAPFPK
jgi:tetratricopeptide (TPR) repeat protein